jgi:membrane-anchored mycosin MYCP
VRRSLIAAAALGLASNGVLVGLAAAPSYAVDNECESVTDADAGDTDAPSEPLALMHLRQAQEVVREHRPPGGEPVGVAVLDSGVYGTPGQDGPIPIRARTTEVTGHDELTYYPGTAVAGLIAGRPRSSGADGMVGIAPHAAIIDVRVYDEGPGSTTEGAVPVTVGGLTEGLRWVARNADDLNIRVANVSLVVVPSTRSAKRDLARAVQEVRDAGVVVVAASGNRPGQGEPFDAEFEDDGPGPGEDAAGFFYPAGFPDVITVNATGDGKQSVDPASLVLMNSRTDVAAPTQGAVSYGLSGSTCLLSVPATSWAAAEVSGVLALLWERYPQDTDEQIIARMLNTANGTMDNPTPLAGVGVVQPTEALTRPLDPKRDGRVDRTVSQRTDDVRAVAPEQPEDLLADTRRDAVWWGLVGGGVLVVALLLRPVLARRRH